MSSLVKQRVLLGIAVLMMLVPTIMFAAGPLRLPPMFEGDELVEVQCPACAGAGTSQGAKCDRCSGKGIVPGIAAGLNRPVQVVGTVTVGGKTIEGALAEVDLGREGSLSVHTNPDGQFGLKLPPGNYQITVSNDQKKVTESVVVAGYSVPFAIEEGGNLRRQEVEFQL